MFTFCSDEHFFRQIKKPFQNLVKLYRVTVKVAKLVSGLRNETKFLSVHHGTSQGSVSAKKASDILHSLLLEQQELHYQAQPIS